MGVFTILLLLTLAIIGGIIVGLIEAFAGNYIALILLAGVLIFPAYSNILDYMWKKVKVD